VGGTFSLQGGNSLFLWNPKVNHCHQKSPPLDPVMGLLNQVHTFTILSSKINFNIALPTTSLYLK